MPRGNQQPDPDSKFNAALRDFVPKGHNRGAAIYEAHQELHKLPSKVLHKIVLDWEFQGTLERLAFLWNAAGDVDNPQSCLTDMPDIRYRAAKAILNARASEERGQ